MDCFLFSLRLFIGFTLMPPEKVIENNFKNCSSETGNNKNVLAECEDPPYTKHLMNSILRK